MVWHNQKCHQVMHPFYVTITFLVLYFTWITTTMDKSYIRWNFSFNFSSSHITDSRTLCLSVKKQNKKYVLIKQTKNINKKHCEKKNEMKSIFGKTSDGCRVGDSFHFFKKIKLIAFSEEIRKRVWFLRYANNCIDRVGWGKKFFTKKFKN